MLTQRSIVIDFVWKISPHASADVRHLTPYQVYHKVKLNTLISKDTARAYSSANRKLNIMQRTKKVFTSRVLE